MKSWRPKNDNYISPKGIAFPIGMVIITVTNINPTNWTYGTWEEFGQGRCLVGVDTSQSEFNSVMKTGGEKTHTLTVAEIAEHRHTGLSWWGDDASQSITLNGGSDSGYNLSYSGRNNGNHTAIQTYKAGGNQPHNNLQPYITVYFWRRVS